MTVAIMIVYFSYLFALAWNHYYYRNHMIFILFRGILEAVMLILVLFK